MLELTLVGRHSVFVHLLRQVAIVGERVVENACYTAIDVEEGSLTAAKLRPLYCIALDQDTSLGNTARVLEQAGFVSQRMVRDDLHVEVVTERIVHELCAHSDAVKVMARLRNDISVNVVRVVQAY